jgi:5-methyltetrahydropteroyltriglutamate--homocysteine methyltransferase
VKRSTDRILTTHVGSLPRPHDLLDMMKSRSKGEGPNDETFAARVRDAVRDTVREQAEHGIDIVADGEMGKLGFFSYVRERLAGFESAPRRSDEQTMERPREINAFPEYYAAYFKRRAADRVADLDRLICTGPVSYRGQQAVQTDIANLKAAMQGLNVQDAFMPAVAPRGVGRNEYYRSEEDFVMAVAEAMREEYNAIVDAGLVLQVDDAWLTSLYGQEDPSVSLADKQQKAELYVEAINHALRGISPDNVRFHTCYGINEGPRVYDTPFKDFIHLMLKVNAGAYSFEAGNPQHEHEWHLWEEVRLPEGKSLIPGVISHTTNVVEHPEAIRDRIENFARLVGRENVIAGADCGFSSNASYVPDIHPRVINAKFDAMAEGARLASRKLWGR